MGDIVEESELREMIKTDLGGDINSLGISDNTIELKIQEAVNKVTAYAPLVVLQSFPVSNGVVEMPAGTTTVIQVLTINNMSTDQAINLEDDINLFSARRYLLGSDPLKDPYMYMMNKTELNTLQSFVALTDYMFDKPSKKLYINNYDKPTATVKFLQRTTDVRDIEDPDIIQFIKEYSLALCKIVEGNIRRKLQNAPGAIQMDGDALVSEGIAERDKLDEKLIKEFQNLRFGIRV